MTGHLLGATGALEAVFSVKAVEEDIIPRQSITIRKIRTKISIIALTSLSTAHRSVPCVPRSSNSFGFGGHNATVIVKKYEDK